MMVTAKRIHFIGIGGSGLSAIARLMHQNGYVVSGSDQARSSFTNELEALGIQVTIGHAAENVAGAELVVRSSAIPDSNPEVLAAVVSGIPLIKRNQFFEKWLKDYRVVAVAGSHGKTTTTSMLAWCLTQMGQDPSYIIGGVSKDLGVNAAAGRSDLFVIEADEYDYMFLGLAPEVALVTNVEHDHPDCYPTPDDYFRAFANFTQRLKTGGKLLVCAASPQAVRLAGEIPSGVSAYTYGDTPGANYQARHVAVNSIGGFDFEAGFQEKPLVKVSLKVAGRHNVLNALASLAAIHQLGLPLSEAAAALAEFKGAGRRFELIGEAGGVAVIDDYAHHPSEIRATLEAARSRYPQRRIWVLWQPHTFSRTRTLKNDFAEAFAAADNIIVTEIFAAREKADGFSALEVVQGMRHPGVRFMATLDEAGDYLLRQLKSGDVLLVLSAGDATRVSAHVLKTLQAKENS